MENPQALGIPHRALGNDFRKLHIGEAPLDELVEIQGGRLDVIKGLAGVDGVDGILHFFYFLSFLFLVL